ncbi:hypothetical protein FGG08_007135 [Glutinoglossum americanum]|uniref:Uncharacterized protein n=1 Tax=Glutinoglossum americanum TaxID=1670608 RepID=A0A9P8I232_9PEZI|nr:hypothetical protein FGG08_007135 [Glutinoglossum americanum]
MDPAQSPKDGTSRPTTSSTSPNRSRQSSVLRRASISLLEANPPLGMWQATGTAIATAPSLADVRRGSFGSSGWTTDPVREGERRRSISVSSSAGGMRRVSGASAVAQPPPLPLPSPREETSREMAAVATEDGISTRPDSQPLNRIRSSPKPPATIREEESPVAAEKDTSRSSSTNPDAPANPNNYIPPPKHTWSESTLILLKAFWKFFLTPSGFLITIYCLNVVAWGGMLFLLLIGGAPAMCHPTCSDINSPRRIWIEIDSQILNALFCVTGFGLIPWRFRDCWFLLRWRIRGNMGALRRLAGINRDWFRLKGSEDLDASPGTEYNPGTLSESPPDAALTNPSLPLPLSKTPDPPLTGIRAPPTALWKLDFVIWMFMLNTFLQAVLSAFMWGYNRYKRPSWSTGLFVALACIVAAMAGIMSAVEGRRVKRIEGVPWGEEDLRKLEMKQDVEDGSGGVVFREEEKEKGG